MCKAIVEAGLTAKCGNVETNIKQMRPAAHMALMFGTTFVDALGKMVERKQVIALYTMQCFDGTQPENLSRLCSYMASPKSTVPGFRKLAKELALGNCGGISLVIPACWWSASSLQDVCCCVVKPLPFVVRHCNATPIQWAAATRRLDEV